MFSGSLENISFYYFSSTLFPLFILFFHIISFCCVSFLFYMDLFSLVFCFFFSQRVVALHLVFGETVKPTFYRELDPGRLGRSAVYCLEPQC
jgi:hypothetical protein